MKRLSLSNSAAAAVFLTFVGVSSFVLLLLVSGCGSSLGYRGGGAEGTAPDFVGDVSYVEVFRNAEDFSNVARVCVLGLGFAATSSTRSTSGPLVRVSEWDGFCATKGSG